MNEDLWFNATSDTDLSDNVFKAVERIEEQQPWVRKGFAEYLTLYCNKHVKLPYQLAGLGQAYPLRLRYNVVSSIVDTLVNKIGSKKIRPAVATYGADWELRGRAKKLEKYVEGVFYASNYYEIAADVLKDACLFGIGYLHIFDDGEDIKLERVSPEEITVDEESARYGNPREMYRSKLIPRDVLQREYPDAAEKLELHSTFEDAGEITDQIEVIEAFHLAVGEHHGRHCICTSELVLYDDKEWELEEFPIIPFWVKKRPLHWTGIGLAEEAISLQRELDKELLRIERIRDTHSRPIMAVKNGSIKKGQLQKPTDNTIVIEYAEDIPVFLNQPTGDEKLNYVEMLYQKIYQLTGVSAMAAQADKPAGDWSGIALRNLADQQTNRFAVLETRFGDLSVNVGRGIINSSRVLYKNRSKKVVFASTRYVETIDWKDAAIDEENFHLKFHPASLLPTTPQGMVQTAHDLLQTGLFTPDQLKQQLDHPDMEQFWSQEQADKNDIQMIIDKMLYEDEYLPPIKYQNLALGLDQVNRAYLQARSQGAPDDVLDNLLQWLDDADALLAELEEEQKRKQAPPAAPQGPPEGAPAGPEGVMPPEVAPGPPVAPEAPPVSTEEVDNLSPEEILELEALGRQAESQQAA